MVINTLAIIGIVFTNKAIFSDPSLKLAQLTFACFHFLTTYLTLFLLSRPALAFFAPRRVPLLDILPLSLAMSLNVILPNLSLAFSSVTYQIARILLTPTAALLNYILYRTTLPPTAILALVPTCLGVAMVSYYNALPNATTTTTATPLGILFALTGTLASSPLHSLDRPPTTAAFASPACSCSSTRRPCRQACCWYVITFAGRHVADFLEGVAAWAGGR
ncbi:hypothetical protein C8A01DRAFT_34892 [Parachaetomium inaequale]|uniref:GDP-mannose transporter n=1 Tax=Parachaetomium inaequale TaxID=2588326 RepID=A0AAN6ST39_9PEZI|nr:hypothetical protein C8A01DRAFT_34892 [Parachaetomium inaequale]